MITLKIVTLLNVLNNLIADSAGNMISALIKSPPTSSIERTITTAISVAKIKLYIFVFTPVAVAKFSSNVIEKILL